MNAKRKGNMAELECMKLLRFLGWKVEKVRNVQMSHGDFFGVADLIAVDDVGWMVVQVKSNKSGGAIKAMQEAAFPPDTVKAVAIRMDGSGGRKPYWRFIMWGPGLRPSSSGVHYHIKYKPGTKEIESVDWENITGGGNNRGTCHEEKRVGKSASFQQPKYPSPEPIKRMKEKCPKCDGIGWLTYDPQLPTLNNSTFAGPWMCPVCGGVGVIEA